jgi:hypothetical protein
VNSVAVTDLPVLRPSAERVARRAQTERVEGTWRLELKARHGLLLIALFVLAVGIAEAQAQSDPDKGVLATS